MLPLVGLFVEAVLEFTLPEPHAANMTELAAVTDAIRYRGLLRRILSLLGEDSM